MPTDPQTIDLQHWERALPHLSERYRTARPFPHIVLDDLIAPAALDEAQQSFPPVDGEGWIHYLHVNEHKHGLNKRERIPPPLQHLVDQLNSPPFVHWLSALTGIPGLLADQALEGGGLHQSGRGGFLNIHADFTAHPHERDLRRRVNLILYLNPGWQEGWGGHLELWERDMSCCAERIAPLHGRCVIFSTDEKSYHGFPDPLQCPEGESRKSLALYFFTRETVRPRLRSTDYRARPGDGLKSVAIWADKQAVSLYTRMKRTFGLKDDVVSRILGRLGRR